jgi:hypothetical protein
LRNPEGSTGVFALGEMLHHRCQGGVQMPHSGEIKTSHDFFHPLRLG